MVRNVKFSIGVAKTTERSSEEQRLKSSQSETANSSQGSQLKSVQAFIRNI